MDRGVFDSRQQATKQATSSVEIQQADKVNEKSDLFIEAHDKANNQEELHSTEIQQAGKRGKQELDSTGIQQADKVDSDQQEPDLFSDNIQQTHSNGDQPDLSTETQQIDKVNGQPSNETQQTSDGNQHIAKHDLSIESKIYSNGEHTAMRNQSTERPQSSNSEQHTAMRDLSIEPQIYSNGEQTAMRNQSTERPQISSNGDQQHTAKRDLSSVEESQAYNANRDEKDTKRDLSSVVPPHIHSVNAEQQHTAKQDRFSVEPPQLYLKNDKNESQAGQKQQKEQAKRDGIEKAVDLQQKEQVEREQGIENQPAAELQQKEHVDGQEKAVDQEKAQGQDLEKNQPSVEIQKAKPPYCALSVRHRQVILGIVTTAGFLGPLAGNIYLPAIPVLQGVFGVGETAINATVTSFMIVFAFAPLIWASLADYGGRRPLYIVSLAIYILANILMAALPANFGALVFLRVVQAFGSAAVVSMGAGTVADLIQPKDRGSAMSYFLLGPQLGPVLGPVIGGAIAEADWRWIFGFLALLGGVIWLVVFFVLPETLRYNVGNNEINAGRWIVWPPQITMPTTTDDKRGPKPPKPTLIGYWRLFSYPPIGIVSFNTAILYATYFSIAVDLPRSLGGVYYWSEAEIGAGYLAVGIALILGSLVGGRVNDWRRKNFVKKTPDQEVAPETRLYDQIWGVCLCAAGTLIYGWLVDFRIHPAPVLIATFITGFGMSWVFVSSTAFLSEAAPQQAAGAFALGNMLRNPAAAVAAVVTPPLISRMGIGWFFTGWAILDLVVVGFAVLLLRVKGPYFRARKAAKIKAMKEKAEQAEQKKTEQEKAEQVKKEQVKT